MKREVDVVIIGAGTAGLSALGQVRKRTDNFIIINDGPYGTTCARIGCMPSKVLIEASEVYNKRQLFEEMGFKLNGTIEVDGKAVLQRVRELRDRFVTMTNRATSNLGDKNISGRAKILSPNLVEVNGDQIKTKSIIIATGSTPIMPDSWRKFSSNILTNENIFEMKDLPKTLAVVGLGAIGLEMAQAFSRLGVDVTGFDALDTIGGITDPEVSLSAVSVIGKDFPIHLKSKIILESAEDNKICVKTKAIEVVVEKVLIAVGRKPNVFDLGLENLGVPLNKFGFPAFNENTMQIGDLPVFIAGDVNNRALFLAEAADDGHIAGVNSIKDKIKSYCRRSSMGIVFSHPNIASVGVRYEDLDLDNTAVGVMNYKRQTRAISAHQNYGILRIYADKSTGKLLGAEMAIPDGEHIAHLISWIIQRGLTVFEAMELNFYHPVTEEGIRSALRSASKNVRKRESGPEVPICM